MNKIKNMWLHQPHTSTIIRHACLAGLLLCSVPLSVSAQSTDVSTQNYSRLSLSYAITQPVISTSGISSVSTHNLYGMSVGYLYGINVTDHRLPLFLEVGPECSYVRRSDEIDYWEDNFLLSQEETRTQLLTFSTPINLAYMHPLSDALMLAPSAGLNAKVNLTAHRFQLGWNAGCGIYLHRYYLGLRYTADFTSFMSQGKIKEKTQTLDLSIGLRF